MKIKKGQIWKSKESKKTLQITRKYSGNRHWVAKDIKRKNTSHRIHEGTLLKYYELLR